MPLDFAELHARLERERKRLTEELAQLYDNKYAMGDKADGWFGRRDEQANEAAELQRRLSAERRTKSLLAKLEYALHKFAEGTYGLCERCGKSIDPARLEALPYVDLCLSCKALQER